MITVGQPALREAILELIEASTGESYCVLLATGGQGLRADSCNLGDIFTGRRVCFLSTFTREYEYWEEPALQKLGACCR